MAADRRLTQTEHDVLSWVLDQGDFRGVAELRAQVDSVVVSGSRLPIDLDLEVSTGAPRSPAPDGPIPVDVIAKGADDDVGFIEVWVEGGYLASLEHSWWTDDMPTEFPKASQLRLWVR